MSTLKKTKKSIIKLLYQLMYDFDYIMNANNLVYWSSGGTTLGAVRHRSMIPWDDDLDVCMKYADRNKLLKLTPLFKKCGYFIVKTWFGYKVCYKNRKLVSGEKYSFPNLDVFLMKFNGKWIPAYKRVRETWPKEQYPKTLLFPLKEYPFGEFTILGPNKPKPYLDKMYGTDWNRIAYREYDHEKEEEVVRVKVKLTEKDRKPVQPTKIIRNKKCLKSV